MGKLAFAIATSLQDLLSNERLIKETSEAIQLDIAPSTSVKFAVDISIL